MQGDEGCPYINGEGTFIGDDDHDSADMADHERDGFWSERINSNYSN